MNIIVQLTFVFFLLTKCFFGVSNSSQTDQANLVSLLWGIWPSLPQYGRKAAQFVDLLGYFTLKTPNIDTEVRIYS